MRGSTVLYQPADRLTHFAGLVTSLVLGVASCFAWSVVSQSGAPINRARPARRQRFDGLLLLATVLIVVGAGVRASVLTIDQSGQKFSEKSLALKSGDALIFANKDDVSHNITVLTEDEETTDLGLQKPGQDLSYKFDKTGRFKVRCSIHPSMKLTVNVKS